MSDAALNGSLVLRQRLARHRHVLMGLGALLCAAVAVHAGKRYLDEQLEAERARLAPEPVAMVSVVVARRDLAKGEPVSVDTMAVRSIPGAYAISSAIRPERFDQYQGARLAVPLRAGEPLLDSAVVGVDQSIFSQRLRQGIRALTISVDEVNAISGLLQPGDRVDLFFTARPPRSGAAVTETTVPLLQNVLVLATGRQVRPMTDQQAGARGYGTITVELAPQQAQQVVVAQRAGRITAVLRHPDDRRLEAASRMDLRQLFGQAEPTVRARSGPQMIVGGMGRQGLVQAAGQGGGQGSGQASSPGNGQGAASVVPVSGAGTAAPGGAAGHASQPIPTSQGLPEAAAPGQAPNPLPGAMAVPVREGAP